jgi:phospholipase/lecithinase/hemolysin
LYVFQFGGNDIRDGLFDSANAGTIVLQAVDAEVTNIQTLYFLGARNFAIANAPNVGRAPAVAAFGPVAIAAAQALSEFHNAVLESGFAELGLPGLSQLEVLLPGINLYRIDMFGFVNDVAENPAAFGVSDPFFPCLQFGVKSGATCDNANERLFWDGIHPTAVAHSALGDIATAAVTID